MVTSGEAAGLTREGGVRVAESAKQAPNWCFENTPSRVRVKWQKSGNKIQKWEAFGRRRDRNRTNMASMLRRNRRKLATMQ